MTAPEPSEFDVKAVAVATGLAGLTAARQLSDAGHTVHVLEARDRVVGRTLGHKLSDGEIIDLESPMDRAHARPRAGTG